MRVLLLLNLISAAVLLTISGVIYGARDTPHHNYWLLDTGTLYEARPDSISLMLPDGAARRTIVPAGRVDWAPITWSPTAEWVFYVACCRGPGSQMDLRAVRVDGARNHPLLEDLLWIDSAQPITAPAPNGSALLAASSSTGQHTLHLIELDPPRARPLVHTRNRLRAFFWSPDSQWVYYVESNPAGYTTYRLRPDGSGHERVIDRDISAGIWSPDGDTLVYSTFYEGQQNVRLTAQGEGMEVLGHSLYLIDWLPSDWIIGSQAMFGASPALMRPDGSEVRTFDRTLLGWSADGQTLYFQGANSTLLRYELATDSFHELLRMQSRPTWHPDQNRFVVAASTPAGPAVVLLNPADGTVQPVFPLEETRGIRATLSPDGQTVFITQTPTTGRPDLGPRRWRVAVATGQSARLPDGDLHSFSPPIDLPRHDGRLRLFGGLWCTVALALSWEASRRERRRMR